MKKIEFEWNDAIIWPTDPDRSVLCQTENDNLMTIKKHAASSWNFFVAKYRIKYWVYADKVMQKDTLSKRVQGIWNEIKGKM